MKASRTANLQPADVIVQRLFIHILAQVDHQGPAARLQHPPHLAKRAHGIGEILERRAAQQEIKAGFGKRHLRGVSFPEIHLDLFLPGIPFGDLHEAFADIQAGDFVFSDLGQLDRKEARTRRDFENLCARRQIAPPLCAPAL